MGKFVPQRTVKERKIESLKDEIRLLLAYRRTSGSLSGKQTARLRNMNAELRALKRSV